MKIVIKRDGTRQRFNKNKITGAIQKALDATEEVAEVGNLTEQVCKKLKGQKEVKVEGIQDIVEQALVSNNLYKVAKAYILYRKKRQEIRMLAHTLGIKDVGNFSVNALQVLASRYLRRDENRNIVEQPSMLFRRTADTIANVDLAYGESKESVKVLSEDFYRVMINNEFMPNSPTLMNAGTSLGQLAACFVLPVNDSIEEIFDTIKFTAMIHKSGGGTGFSFSHIRPEGDLVQTTGGIASGPLSFMEVFNAATEVIKQGGKRRGANLGVLNVTHPDIFDFVTAKTREGKFENFNISVGMSNDFVTAVTNDTSYWLVNPRTQKQTRKVKARAVWDLMITEAWRSGDPGIIFLDTVNNSTSNCIPKYGPIESTNPCGEVPLYPYEVCNLGSINLSTCVKNKQVDYDKIKYLSELGVHFLDNVIDANKYPLEQIKKMAMLTRRIGLGIMGFADMLIQLGIPYDSDRAIDIAYKVMRQIKTTAHNESALLGGIRGSFPDFENSVWPKQGFKQLRNCCCTTIAPTGTISIIAGGCSSGIEPLFSVSYVRQVSESLGANLVEINPQFEQVMVREGLYNDELLEKVSKSTSIQTIEDIPEDLRKIFKTAHDIAPEWHVRMQAVFQAHVDNAISKTINFPEWATPRDIEDAYMLAWKLGCKGITVYRDKCKSKQVLTECPRCVI
jgi:ribonucleoside-diphosphate reductase alpha chain